MELKSPLELLLGPLRRKDVPGAADMMSAITAHFDEMQKDMAELLKYDYTTMTFYQMYLYELKLQKFYKKYVRREPDGISRRLGRYLFRFKSRQK
jgi:hypothetical protein